MNEMSQTAQRETTAMGLFSRMAPEPNGPKEGDIKLGHEKGEIIKVACARAKETVLKGCLK